MKGNDKVLTVLNKLLAEELTAINQYMVHSRSVDDQGTAYLLTKILRMEEDHQDWDEMQRAQIEQMGLENYLADQTECAAV